MALVEFFFQWTLLLINLLHNCFSEFMPEWTIHLNKRLIESASKTWGVSATHPSSWATVNFHGIMIIDDGGGEIHNVARFCTSFMYVFRNNNNNDNELVTSRW